MNVNATLNGEAVTIVSMTIERYRALIAYIDAQGGPGNLEITEVPIGPDDLDTDLIIATAASHN